VTEKKFDTVQCLVWTGHDDSRPLDKLLADQLAKHPPELVWREPINGPKPIAGFQGLATADALAKLRKTGSDEQPALVEARLFYDHGLLHLLADGQGTRWAAWLDKKSESPTADVPPATPADQPQAAYDSPAWRPATVDKPKSAAFSRTSRPILLRHEDRRRGLQLVTGLSDKTTTAFEYYQQGVLRWWRLEAK
jgi:hypothetical protein